VSWDLCASKAGLCLPPLQRLPPPRHLPRNLHLPEQPCLQSLIRLTSLTIPGLPRLLCQRRPPRALRHPLMNFRVRCSVRLPGGNSLCGAIRWLHPLLRESPRHFRQSLHRQPPPPPRLPRLKRTRPIYLRRNPPRRHPHRLALRLRCRCPRQCHPRRWPFRRFPPN